MANERARQLRKTMTPQEVRLWGKLHALRAQGFHFRRQSPQQGYIVDFVCLKHKLVVEVDGAQHGLEAHLARDARRDSTLNRDGFAVLRFWNNEINDDIDGIVDTIFHRLTTMSVPLSG